MTAEERSKLARRASLSRKTHGGGRPRKDDQPEASIKLYRRDLAVFKSFAAEIGCPTMKGLLNIFARALIAGGTFKKRPYLAEQHGWRQFAR